MAYPPPLDKAQVRICAWMHRWPESVIGLALEGIDGVQEEIVREYGSEFQRIDARLLGQEPKDRADALRDRELLADRIVAREAQLVLAGLASRGVDEEAAYLASSSLADHRRSVLGCSIAPVLGGGGDRDVRPILHGLAQSAVDPAERAELAELAADLLPDLGSLMRERRRIARRAVPESTQLFAALHAAESGEARQQILARRSTLLRPLAAVERRIVEASQSAMRRFSESTQDDARRARVRAEVLDALYGPLGRDPWDSAPLVALAQAVAGQPEKSPRTTVDAGVDAGQALVGDVRSLAESQASDRELEHRAALAAVTRYWCDFRERMVTSPQDNERLMGALSAWHARSRARAEELARRIEQVEPGTGSEVRALDIQRQLRAWRESAEALETAQLQVFSFGRPRPR